MENDEENEKIIKCFMCQMDILRVDYYRNHYEDCRRKNTIRSLDVRRNQTYIKDGKMYKILDIVHVYRRGGGRFSQINHKIVELYCEEDQSKIRMAFRWDKRFVVDKNNCIIITPTAIAN
jgi:hypothetical protein